MAFTRIDLLPHNDLEERNAARERWGTDEGREISERITELIRKGASEDFLQYD